MRFVSKWGAYTLLVREPINVALGAGLVEQRQSPIYTHFKVGGLLPHERQLAMETFAWNGQPHEADEVTMVPPDHRISVWDSETCGLPPDELELAIEKLRSYAIPKGDVIEIPATMLKPPWPRYAEYSGSPSALTRKLVDEGYDLDVVLKDERATENREPIVKALEEKLLGGDREEEVVG